MKHLHIYLEDLKVCTLNNARYRNGNRTKAAREYTRSIFNSLIPYIDEIDKFSNHFNSLPIDKRDLSIELYILVPKKRFKTLKGEISRRSIDIDNYLKLFLDSLLDNKYHEKEFLNTELDEYQYSTNFRIDDKYITSLYVSKDEGEDKELWDFILDIKSKY